MKFYSPCCGQCKVVAKEFKDHPIDAPVKDINVMEFLSRLILRVLINSDTTITVIHYYKSFHTP